MNPLWIAIALHELPLDAACPLWSEQQDAFAVLEQECIIAASPIATRLGVKIGMRRAGALAVAPQVQLLPRQAHAEAQVLQNVGETLLQYTPEAAHHDASTIILNVGASAQVFGGPRALSQRVAASVSALNLHARLGMAPTAGGACLLAKDATHSRRRCLRLRSLQGRLNILPLALLPETHAKQDWLHDIACHTLGHLRALPRGGLQQRCGVPLLQALDSAYGLKPELYPWIYACPQFHQRIELNDYIDNSQALLHVAQRLAQQLSTWLTARHGAVSQLSIHLEHERGRRACPPTVLPLALAQATRQADHLVLVLREKLARFVLPAPVIAMALHAPNILDQQTTASASLFPEPPGNAADRTRLLDVLAARLGPGCIRHASPLADYRPEVANTWVSATDSLASPLPLPANVERPFWLLDTPIALDTVRHRPVYAKQTLRLLRGPERIEGAWWDASLTLRDYFVAEDTTGARYWLYRERDAQSARWFLHGLYA